MIELSSTPEQKGGGGEGVLCMPLAFTTLEEEHRL